MIKIGYWLQNCQVNVLSYNIYNMNIDSINIIC